MTPQSITHYEIIEKLGEGGMGVVYKARDIKLDRMVAIKVLPAGKTGDASRKQRFIQEARAASALNHPNIVTIHEIAEENGIDFIVMEYVAGKTLDQAIPRRGMRVGETLGLATQIAGALAAAHEAKIVHRDLKPGNVMVSDKGVVKLLDFGLAKLQDKAPLGEDENTRTAGPRTEEGSILGTVSYMSPEQAEAKPVDGRSDIFSFGAVLYEMLTGQRAFLGESRISTLSRILNADPPPLHEVAPEVPVELERIVNRCLRKDPRKRFQGVADLEIALQELKEESDSGRLAAPVAGAAKPLPPSRIPGRAAWWVTGAAATLSLAAGVAWYRMPAPAAKAGAPNEAALTQLTFDSGLTVEPSFWPGGNMIAYASDRATGANLDIWIQQMGGEAKRLTTHAADDRSPSFSPDGTKIAFRSERDGGGIYVVSTLGGTERKLVAEGRDPHFSPDGRWIAYWIGQPGVFYRGGYGPSRSYVIPAAGGAPKELGVGGGPIWASNTKILFQGYSTTSADIYVTDFPSGTPAKTGVYAVLAKQKLVMGYGPMTWTGKDLILTAGTGNLWRIPLSPETFQATGDAHRLTAGAHADSHANAEGKHLIYGAAFQNDDVWSLPIESDSAAVRGDPLRLTQELSSELGSSVTADGKRIAFMSLRNNKVHVMLRDLTTGVETTLHTFDEPRTLFAAIRPDGKQVAWVDGQGKSYLASADGSGGVEPIAGPDGGVFRCWAGSRRMIWTKGRETFLLEPENKRSWLAARSNFSSPHASADGRWVAGYDMSTEGRSPIVIFTLGEEGAPADSKDVIQVTDGSHFDALPDFSPDGNRLYFVSHHDGFQCLWTIRLDPRTKRPLGEPKEVYHFHSAQRSPTYVMFGRRMLTVAKDKIVFNMAQRTGNIWMTDLPEEGRP